MFKQLSKREYILSISLLVILIIVVAAFFLGVKVGQRATENRYAHLIDPVQAVPEDLEAYDQQYLTSFYHTIYLPYREFSEKWFEHMETIELQNESINPEALLEELEQLAQLTYEEIQVIAVPETAVAIHDAHRHYLRSLNLFQEALGDRSLIKQEGASLIAAINSDEFIQEAKHYALEGQKSFYLSIVKWHEETDASAPLLKDVNKGTYEAESWENMPLNVKNYIVASILTEQNIYKKFTPPDAVVSIDHLIRSGQAEQLKLDTIESMVGTLVQMNTVRETDFIKQKQKLYSDERLPQLLFYE